MFTVDHNPGISLGVQWFTLRASNAEGADLISGWGTKIPHALHAAKKKKVAVTNSWMNK